MKIEDKREIRFYVCLILAYILLMISLYLPPVNVITTSVLYASIALLGTGALATGIDISGILHEINELKHFNYTSEQFNNNNKKVQENEDKE